MKKIFALLALSTLPCFAQSQNIPVKNASEITGCWERIDFSEQAKKQINEIEPWPARYQWFCFDPDGTYSSVMSSNYTPQSSKTLHEALKPIPKNFSYSVLQPGLIKTQDKAGLEELIWVTTFMGKTVPFDNKVINQGTLIMFLVDPKKNKPVYYRYLKHVQ